MHAETYRAYRAADVAYRDALDAYNAAAAAAYGPMTPPAGTLDIMRVAADVYRAAHDTVENAYRAWMTAGYPRP